MVGSATSRCPLIGSRGCVLPPWPPVPPIEMPPARTVSVPDRGEFFLRDTGGDGDRRDAAARLDRDRRPQLVGGVRGPRRRRSPRARDRPSRPRPRAPRARPVPPGGLRRRRRRRAADAWAPIPRSSSATRWAARSRSWWRAITPTSSAGSCSAAPPSTGRTQQAAVPSGRWASFGLMLSLAPRQRRSGPAMRRARIRREPSRRPGSQSELMRHSARDIAEAGRELGRFDSRPWLGAAAPAGGGGA